MSDYDPFQPQCVLGHPIEIVSEGYGICCDEWVTGEYDYYSWAFTKPVNLSKFGWVEEHIIGRDGQEIPAWVYFTASNNKHDALAWIQKDMDLRRAMPFDEETERARLMPV